jgi:hypothetical protein
MFPIAVKEVSVALLTMDRAGLAYVAVELSVTVVEEYVPLARAVFG